MQPAILALLHFHKAALLAMDLQLEATLISSLLIQHAFYLVQRASIQMVMILAKLVTRHV